MIQRSLEKKRSGQGGFTLIELLIVIVILGILAAIVVLAIGGLKDSSQTAACNSEQKTLVTAEDAFFASTGGGTDYATGQELFDAHLVKENPAGANSNWDVTQPGGAASYTIHGINDCAGLVDDAVWPVP
jgi:general secretion pathway protein G